MPHEYIPLCAAAICLLIDKKHCSPLPTFLIFYIWQGCLAFRQLEMLAIIKEFFRVVPNWNLKMHKVTKIPESFGNLRYKLSAPNCTKLVLKSCLLIVSAWKSWFCSWSGSSLKVILLLPRYKWAIYLWLKECFLVQLFFFFFYI